MIRRALSLSAKPSWVSEGVPWPILRHLAAVEPCGAACRRFFANFQERTQAVLSSLTSRALQLAGSLCGTIPVVDHNRRDDALQDGCPAACRSTKSICDHGRTGYL